jgi:hypothetical protein
MQLQQFRAIATRYDKTAKNFLSGIPPRQRGFRKRPCGDETTITNIIASEVDHDLRMRSHDPFGG